MSATPFAPEVEVSQPIAFEDVRIGVIGLGYVGLPLAVAFARRFPTVGYDTSGGRIDEIRGGRDHTLEVSPQELGATTARFSDDPADLDACNFFVVTVPTPVDDTKRPDLGPLTRASRELGRRMTTGAVAVFESTVYPGATEEDCAPLIAELSGLTLNRDFFVGYSPERVNPGDRAHRLDNVVKVVSGSTPAALDLIDRVYASIVGAGTHRAASIRVAEAAKVIENTQRDVNIALVNELAKLFERLGIDTLSVLETAGTKWNFLPFRPGLVGGHCIGVDPYYLTHKAQQVGHHPDVILAGRRINDSMGGYVASRLIKALLKSGRGAGARVLVMGFAFKENCPDFRNTRVIDIVEELLAFGVEVAVHDPWLDAAEVRSHHGIELTGTLDGKTYDAVVLAVAHRQFGDLGADGIRSLVGGDGIVFDVKGLLPLGAADIRL